MEKPPAATIQDVDAMLDALERTGKYCAVGFQAQSAPSVRGLKKEICAGTLGAIREVIVIGQWKRMNDYFTRNRWSGRFMLDGNYILDGTVNNPMAHYLFNALYFISPEWNRAAMPRSVRAELYHAHHIESEDNSCLEVVTENGAKIYFYGTLCAPEEKPVTVEVIGERGRASWAGNECRIFQGDKEVKVISDNGVESKTEQFRNIVRYQRGLDSELNCPLAMTRAHTLACNGAFESARKTLKIPDDKLFLRKMPDTGAEWIELPNIVEIMQRAAQERKLYSDMGIEWARPTKPFALKNYKLFDMKSVT
jgi:predicted dehydrogenase